MFHYKTENCTAASTEHSKYWNKMANHDFDSSLYLLFASLVLIILRSQKKKLPSGTRPLPGPHGLPLLGSAPFLPPTHTWLKFTEWSRMHGPIYAANLAGTPTIWISSPKIAEELLVKRAAIYSDRPHFAPIDGDNRTSMKYLPLLGHTADYHRAKLFATRLMSSVPPQHLHSIIEAQTRTLLQNLATTPQDFQRHLELCTSSISAQMAWGDSSVAVAAETLRRANELLRGISPETTLNQFPWLRHLPSWIPDILQPWKPIEQARAERERKFWTSMRNAAFSAPAKEQVQYSWTHQSLTLPPTMSEEEMTYSIGMLSLIGGMLVSTPIQHFFLAMTHYPSWQARGQDEVDAVCGDRMPTFADMARMPVVRAIIRETMRWRSSVPYGVPHLLQEDDVYEGYHLPKGSHVFALEWALNRNPELYPNPSTFDPSRWLDPAFPTYREPLSLYPSIKSHSGFGWGRRTCIGQDHAEAVVFTVVACVLWGLSIEKKKDVGGLDRGGKDVDGDVDVDAVGLGDDDLQIGPGAIVRPRRWDVDVRARREGRGAWQVDEMSRCSE